MVIIPNLPVKLTVFFRVKLICYGRVIIITNPVVEIFKDVPEEVTIRLHNVIMLVVANVGVAVTKILQ